ncbi:MAG: P-II family nitrogen regulator [Balneolales bacterium]|nr:P-II family nitrogen regulator [Balneolales bacterium]
MSESNIMRQKLIITIVQKGDGSKVAKAAKKDGAEGATTLFGLGTAPPGMNTFWGIEMSSEREIILIMASSTVVNNVFTAVRRIMKLHKPGNGISFIMDILHIAGCVHLSRKIHKTPRKTENYNDMVEEGTYDLIVTIVNGSHSAVVIEASREAGAEGGTVLHGRGSGIHETSSLFSIDIEPEKDIILTLVDRKISEKVLKSIVEKSQLNEHGNGIAFLMEVEDVAGIAHRLKKD